MLPFDIHLRNCNVSFSLILLHNRRELVQVVSTGISPTSATSMRRTSRRRWEVSSSYKWNLIAEKWSTAWNISVNRQGGFGVSLSEKSKSLFPELHSREIHCTRAGDTSFSDSRLSRPECSAATRHAINTSFQTKTVWDSWSRGAN